MSHKYRYVATAALAVVLAAGAAACGSDSEPQLRSEGASVQQNAEYLEQAGGDAAWAARIAEADNPEAVEAAARAARVAGSTDRTVTSDPGRRRGCVGRSHRGGRRIGPSPRDPRRRGGAGRGTGGDTPPVPTSTSRTSPTSSRVAAPVVRMPIYRS